MQYVGLDVHLRRSTLEILNSNGQSIKHLEVVGPWSTVLEKLDAHVQRPFSICYEASCGYGYLHDRLSDMAQHVAVAHPGHLRLIFQSKKKNDRVDAGKLAKLLYLDAVPKVHVPTSQVRSWRGLIEFRHRLMSRRVSVKNQIRGLLRGLGIESPRSLWTKAGVQWLTQLAMPDESNLLRRDVLIEELAEYDNKIRRVEKELARLAANCPAVGLLMTIPGVGIRTAEAVVSYIDDVRRFGRIKEVGSYFGLVPCQDSSAGRNRLGHITKDGPATVRKMLCESAWQAVRRSPTLRRYFDRITHDDPDRRKIALVATAHHLARVMAAMLRSGEVWHESNDAPAPMTAVAPLRKTPDRQADIVFCGGGFKTNRR